jgi:CRISPR/Cas system CMR-associated protein Cmr5 small subunit
VDVYCVRSGKKSPEPQVVPELILKDGRWLFVDFHRGKKEHSGDGSLLSALKEARESREKHSE